MIRMYVAMIMEEVGIKVVSWTRFVVFILLASAAVGLALHIVLQVFTTLIIRGM